MEKKYLFANIRIPIEVKTNGSIEPLKEYISIDFVKCNELPRKPEKVITNDFVMNSIKQIMKTDIIQNNVETQTEFPLQEEVEQKPAQEARQEQQEEPILVLKEEIKHNIKPRTNTSFKSNPRPLHRTTQKNY
jgi:hypothetical protein